MDAASNGVVKLSGLDALSYFYHTKKGGAKLTGVIYWLFHRRVTVPVAELNRQVWGMRDAIFTRSFQRTREIARIEVPIQLPRAEKANGCGAQALRQAADELGVKYLPQNRVFNGEAITDSAAEQAIFNVTMKPLATGRGDSISLGRGYTSVAHILAVAREMRLKSKIYSSCRNWIGMNLIRPEAAIWRQINGYSPVKLGSVPPLCNRERLILHCKAGDEGHFVMLRPDGSCYDPGTGLQYSSKADFLRATKWQFSGWSILLHNDAGLPG